MVVPRLVFSTIPFLLIILVSFVLFVSLFLFSFFVCVEIHTVTLHAPIPFLNFELNLMYDIFSMDKQMKQLSISMRICEGEKVEWHLCHTRRDNGCYVSLLFCSLSVLSKQQVRTGRGPKGRENGLGCLI